MIKMFLPLTSNLAFALLLYKEAYSFKETHFPRRTPTNNIEIEHEDLVSV